MVENFFSLDNFMEVINSSKTHRISKTSDTQYCVENTDTHFSLSSRQWMLDINAINLQTFESDLSECILDGGFLHSNNAAELQVDISLESVEIRLLENYINQYQATTSNGVHIELSFPTDLYIYARICTTKGEDFQHWTLPNKYLADNLGEFSRSLNLFATLKITWNSGNNLNQKRSDDFDAYVNELMELIEKYTFNVAYHTGIVLKNIVTSKTRHTYTQRHGIASRDKRRNISLVPEIKYDPSLLKYYNLALLSPSPFAEFLAFYQIIEYCFDSDKPEQKMIKRTIKTYISEPVNLRDKIFQIEKSAVDYYQNNGVEFASSALKIIFSKDRDTVLNSIATRIYETRCAVVHNKEDSLDRFVPIKHDSELCKEIPLVRAVAEEIIINKLTV